MKSAFAIPLTALACGILGGCADSRSSDDRVLGSPKSRRWRDGTKVACRSATEQNPKVGAGEIAHNDVIGIAIDLDAGKAYFSRNGTWVGGPPGSNGGIVLSKGLTYHMAAVISASMSAAGNDRWTANFGKSRFRYALPRGYKSYDGKQRG